MIDLIIILLFIAYAIYSGFSSQKEAGKNLQEYFLAGKSLRGWKAGISMAATQFAADTPLLVTGMIATGGIFLLWRLWIYGIAFLLLAFLFSTKWRRAEVITDAEVAEIRYSGKGVTLLRVLKAVYYGTVINCTVMAMVLVAAMRIAEVFLVWNEWLPESVFGVFYNIIDLTGLTVGDASEGSAAIIRTTNNLISIFIILGFTTLYSTTGGLRSVVATDIAQFGFAMLGTILFAGFILFKAGGFGTIIEKIETGFGMEKSAEILSFSPGIGEILMPFLIIISLQWLFQMNSDGTGYLAQRMMACQSDRQARVAGLTFTWLQIFLRSLVWLIIGVGLLALALDSDPGLITQILEFDTLPKATKDSIIAAREMSFVQGINDLLPPGVKGIMLTGLLGALASTLDTHLNWGSSYWSNDIYADLVCKKWLKKKTKSSELVWVARFSNLLILFIALTIMFNLGSIQEAWKLSLLFGAGMGAVLVMRWLWERINLFSEIAAIITSLILAPILLNFLGSDSQEWMRLLIMALGSTFIAIAVTFFTPATSDSTLDSFYLRVKPQGFWKKTAVRNGDSEMAPFKKLGTSLTQTGITAVSLFCLLVGFGKLMFRPSSEGIGLVIVLLLIGLALVPVWWKSVMAKEQY